MDFGIITPLPVELESVLAQTKSYSRIVLEQNDNRTYYKTSILTERKWNYEIVITLLPRMGNLDSALATSDMLHLWKPRFILVIGIAAGMRKEEQEFGDVLIGESILYYEQSKTKEEGTEIRPRILIADPLLYDRALNFSLESKDWFTRIPEKMRLLRPEGYRPKAHFGPLASGEKIVASRSAAESLRMHHPKLIGLEMESAGVASAALSSVEKIGFLPIRGVSDFADADKNDDWHQYASSAAAAWAFGFLSSGPVTPHTNQEPQRVRSYTSPTTDRVELYNQIRTRIDNEDFKTLCFMLGVDVDDIPGDRKGARVRELILYFERRGALEKLAQMWAHYQKDSV